MQPSAMSLPFPRHPVSQPSAVLTVSELNEIIRDRLETGLDAVWVAGELSNVRLPPSGHIYFTLKDQQSQISAVLFRRHAENLRFRMEDGMEVVCSGRVGLYTVRGALQFYAVEVEARGKGALAVAFEQLKKRLSQEGLFDVDRKKPLPFLPRTIGIVTSLHGAAVRDMLSIIGERFPDRRVVIRPVRVQGEGAAEEIAQGIRELDGTGMLDVLIVGRGGGSLEDLWAFNEEVVARGHGLGAGSRRFRRRTRNRRDHRRLRGGPAGRHPHGRGRDDPSHKARAGGPGGGAGAPAAARHGKPVGTPAGEPGALGPSSGGSRPASSPRADAPRRSVAAVVAPSRRFGIAAEGASGSSRRAIGRRGSAGGPEARLQHRVPGVPTAASSRMLRHSKRVIGCA